ncbi:MAG: hypothetical protein HYZ40_06660 [Rhodospirillales bacterium]|nr:hypothetical protein [Rhodospirillales bacterium]
MGYAKKIAAAIAAFVIAPAIACAATIGGVWYAPQYDFADFWTATDNKTFQVVIEGNPFPNMPADEMAQRLLPVMQIAKPRPNLTFTYDKPAEIPRPYYRLMLVFDYPNDLGADSVCQGRQRTARGTPGVFKVFAIYCRNDMTMSQTTAWTPATGPDDPRVQELFRELFMVVFTDSMAVRPHNGFDRQ